MISKRFFTKENTRIFGESFLATGLIFSTVLFAAQAYAAAVTLSVTVNTSLTFTISSNQFSRKDNRRHAYKNQKKK
jgi:hypothetical protein